MGTDHIVEQGEHLTQIAQTYGFRDFLTIWNHPANAALKKLRQSPNVLLPGDTLHVPDKTQKVESRGTGATHRFILSRTRLVLRLALRDFVNEPIANTKCELRIDGVVTSLTTDTDGKMQVPIKADAKGGVLIFDDPEVPFDLSVPIKIGYLDPVEEVSGQKARLSNLGYITRSLEDVDDTFFEHIVQEFQCDFELPITGVCDAKTRDKIKELHGS